MFYVKIKIYSYSLFSDVDSNIVFFSGKKNASDMFKSEYKQGFKKKAFGPEGLLYFKTGFKKGFV
jgi:hypothetical protein